MLSLARQGYTEAQVVAALTASTGNYGCRFEILDNARNVVGELSASQTGVTAYTPGTVTAASVTMDGERKLTGSLDLKMLPDDRLRDVPFAYRIRPVFRVGPMPDGGTVEFACGDYPWSVPEKDIAPGVEEWTLTLADGLMDLDSGGPGTAGFQVYKGELDTQAIARIIEAVGFPSQAGISHSSTMAFAAPRSWGLTRPQQAYGIMYLPAWQEGWGFFVQDGIISVGGDPSSTRTTTWLDIATEIHAGIGYVQPWVNWEGLYRAKPANDWTVATPVATFGTTTSSITVSPVHTTNDLSHFCNRVFSWSEASGTAIFFVELDANDVVPNHPLCQARIDRYADQFITDGTADTQLKAEAQCRAALLAGLGTYQRVTYNTLFFPVEPYDITGCYVAGDHEFGSLQIFEERKLSLDLFTGVMAHEAARTFVDV